MNNTDICVVKNRSASVVVYSIAEDGIRRTFAPGESKRISFEELEKLTFQPGGTALLAAFLQVQNPEVTQEFGIHTEPEYNMSETDIINLIKTGSLDAFLDALDFAPIGVIDLIKKFSVSIPLTDFNKRKALKEKTGFDVDAALHHAEEDREDEGSKIESTPQRRVKESAPATPGRRTAGNYNIISKGEPTTTATSNKK